MPQASCDGEARRVREPGATEWWDLRPDAPLRVGDAILRRYHLPDAARILINREAVVSVSFESIRPPELNNMTVTFPWLTYGFDGEIAIAGDLQTPAWRRVSSCNRC